MSRIGPLSRFFYWCGGVNLDILRQYSMSSTLLLTSGILVFLTGVFAWISGSFALYTIFGDIERAIAVGFLWGIFIFFIDRFFVASIKKRADRKKWMEWIQAAPRLVLAVLIGIVVARPLELRIFQTEITKEFNRQVGEELSYSDSLYTYRINQTQARLDSGRAKYIAEDLKYSNDLDGRINALREELTAKERKSDTLFQAYLCEREPNVNCPPGYEGSGKRGDGPIAELRRKEWIDYRDRTLPPERNRIEGLIQELEKKRGQSGYAEGTSVRTNFESRLALELDRLTNRKREDSLQIVTDSKESLLNRNNVLSDITKNDTGAAWMVYLVTLLFVFLETAPVLGKLLFPYNPYDAALEELNFAAQDELARLRYISKEELKINRELVKMLSNAERQVINERIRNWRKEEMDRETNRRRNENSSGNNTERSPDRDVGTASQEQSETEEEGFF